MEVQVQYLLANTFQVQSGARLAPRPRRQVPLTYKKNREIHWRPLIPIANGDFLPMGISIPFQVMFCPIPNNFIHNLLKHILWKKKNYASHLDCYQNQAGFETTLFCLRNKDPPQEAGKWLVPARRQEGG